MIFHLVSVVIRFINDMIFKTLIRFRQRNNYVIEYGLGISFESNVAYNDLQF